MNKRLIIIGAGGHGKVCANIAEDMHTWDKINFLDDHKKGNINGHYVLGPIALNDLDFQHSDFFVGLGDSKIREKLMKELRIINASIVNLIHPTAYISSYHTIGLGIVIMPNAVLNTNVTCGHGVIINSGAIVEHDSQVHDYVHLSPGVTLSGNVSIGEHTWIGTGSTIINNVNISKHILIGAHSLVIGDLTEQGTYYGVPVHKH